MNMLTVGAAVVDPVGTLGGIGLGKLFEQGQPAIQGRFSSAGYDDADAAVGGKGAVFMAGILGGGLTSKIGGFLESSFSRIFGGSRIPALRQQYIDAVGGLSGKAADMRAAGHSSEEIARALHADRRDLGLQFKDLTPEAKRMEIYDRNTKKYGDPLGPSIDWLRAQGKSWDQIIESSTRTGGKDLKF